jgi:hypothetical protein
MKKAVELKKEKYTVQVNYSEEAEQKKLMKFITPSGDEFEISADEMMTMLVGQVNSEVLEAVFVETDRVNVVEVTRQLRVRADRDIQKGEEIRLDYTHPYPVEFAIIEEGMKIAKINKDVPVFTLTAEYLEEVKSKITPHQKKFISRLYESFKGLFKRKN